MNRELTSKTISSAKSKEFTNEERDFIIKYKTQLDNKIFQCYKKEILEPFIEELTKSSEYYNMAYSIAMNVEDFLKVFGALVYQNFDIKNPNFKEFWNAVKPKLQQQLKDEFFNRLKASQTSKNKSNINPWALLQYNDYQNLMNDDEYKQSKIKKMSKQKELLDNQIAKKKLIDKANNIIDSIARKYVDDHISTNEILYKELGVKNSDIEQMKLNKQKNDNLTVEVIKDKSSIGIASILNQTTKDSINQYKEKIKLNESSNLVTININFNKKNEKTEVEDKQEVANPHNTFFNDDNKLNIRQQYIKMLEMKNNKIDIKDFDFKKDPIKIDKHTVYSLRNSSNIFFN